MKFEKFTNFYLFLKASNLKSKQSQKRFPDARFL